MVLGADSRLLGQDIEIYDITAQASESLSLSLSLPGSYNRRISVIPINFSNNKHDILEKKGLMRGVKTFSGFPPLNLNGKFRKNQPSDSFLSSKLILSREIKA